MIQGKVLGPIHQTDLDANVLIRQFLMKFSSPMRYLFGLVAGLMLGALYPDNVTQYWALLLATALLAITWVLLSLFARSVAKDALRPMLGDTENLSDYQLMFSKTWIAAVKEKEAADD
jgi:hypothetical protein